MNDSFSLADSYNKSERKNEIKTKMERKIFDFLNEIIEAARIVSLSEDDSYLLIAIYLAHLSKGINPYIPIGNSLSAVCWMKRMRYEYEHLNEQPNLKMMKFDSLLDYIRFTCDSVVVNYTKIWVPNVGIFLKEINLKTVKPNFWPCPEIIKTDQSEFWVFSDGLERGSVRKVPDDWKVCPVCLAKRPIIDE